MANFNATRYGYSKGNLSDGFQGRPDLGVYNQAIKESQNFHSGLDGVSRFRKGFSNENNSAPAVDSSNTTTGTFKTIVGFGLGSPAGWFFLDFCKDKTTGKLSTVYLREEGLGYYSQSAGTFTTVIVSNTVAGVITLTDDMTDELHRVGSFVFEFLASSPAYRPLLISSVDTDKKEITVVQADGQAFSASNPLVIAGDTLGVSGWVLTTPLDEDFDWDAGGNAIYMVDGATRVKIAVGVSSATLTENYTVTNDPFPAGEQPSKVTFYQNRLTYGGFTDPSSGVFLSRAPDTSGVSRYDDFTTGAEPLDAIIAYINPDNLAPITAVKWLQGGKNTLFVGVNDGVAEISSVGIAITPSDIDVSVFSLRDPSDVKGVVYDNFVNWVSRDGDKLYESSFNNDYDADASYDTSILTDIRSNIKQIIRFVGKEEGAIILLDNGDMVMCIRGDEKLFSFFPISVPLGRALAPGDSVESLYTYPSSEGQILGANIYVSSEEEYRVFKLNIDEFFRYDFLYYRPEMFPYMAQGNDVVLNFFNGIKHKYLDDSIQHFETVDETIDGTGTYITINESDNTTYDLKITSDTALLLAGKQIAIPELGIVIEYKLAIGTAGNFYADYVVGGAELGDYDLSASPIRLSGTRLEEMYVNFSSFTTSTNSKISASAKVIANGTVVSDTPVEASGDYGYYTVTLTSPAFFVQIGLSYQGMFTMLPLTPSGSGQLGYNRPKSISKFKINLINTGDGTIRVNRLAGSTFQFKDNWVFDWKRYFNDVYEIRPEGGWSEKTEVTFIQKESQPLNISFMDIFQSTSDG